MECVSRMGLPLCRNPNLKSLEQQTKFRSDYFHYAAEEHGVEIKFSVRESKSMYEMVRDIKPPYDNTRLIEEKD